MCKKRSPDLVEQFDKSIFVDYGNIGVDFVEASLDSLIKNPVLKNIPVLGTIQATVKTVVSVKEWFLFRKLGNFIKNIANRQVTEKERQKYREVFGSNENKRKELGRLLVFLDKQTDIEKSEYLSLLFLALIDEKLTYEQFGDYSELLDIIMYSDLRVLKTYWSKLDDSAIIKVKNCDIKCFNRLSSQGVGEFVFTDGGRIDKNNNEMDKCEPYRFDKYSQTFINLIFGMENHIKEGKEDIKTLLEVVEYRKPPF